MKLINTSKKCFGKYRRPGDCKKWMRYSDYNSTTRVVGSFDSWKKHCKNIMLLFLVQWAYYPKNPTTNDVRMRVYKAFYNQLKKFLPKYSGPLAGHHMTLIACRVGLLPNWFSQHGTLNKSNLNVINRHHDLVKYKLAKGEEEKFSRTCQSSMHVQTPQRFQHLINNAYMENFTCKYSQTLTKKKDPTVYDLSVAGQYIFMVNGEEKLHVLQNNLTVRMLDHPSLLVEWPAVLNDKDSDAEGELKAEGETEDGKVMALSAEALAIKSGVKELFSCYEENGKRSKRAITA